MNKKTLPIILVLVLILIVFIGGYYIYNTSVENENLPINNNSANNQQNNQGCQGDECDVENSVDFFDGVFDRAEGNMVYFKPEGSEQLKAIAINDQTIFSELTLSEGSEEYEVVSEESINLSDLVRGNNISVFAAYLNDDSESDNLGLASKINRVIIEEQAGVINSSEAIDGSFNRIENDLIYFQSEKSGNLESAKINDQTTFAELTMSASFEVLSEESINASSLSAGDDVTVFIGYDSSGEAVVVKLLRIIVLDE